MTAERLPHPHIWPLSTALIEGRLAIGDLPLDELARTYGTPLYVLDGATIRTKAARYRAAFQKAYGGHVMIHYASKALLNTGVAQLMQRLGLGLDVVSGGELQIAQRAGFDLRHVHLHGNATPLAELQLALDLNIGRIIVDNLDQLAMLDQLTKQREQPQSILLRVAPDVTDTSAHAHIQTGAAAAKFGLPIHGGTAAQAVAMALRSPGLQLDGLHMHIGSQLRDWEALRQAITRLLQFVVELRDSYNWVPRELSPGGGLAVAYKPDEQAPDLDRYASTIAQAVTSGCERWGLPLPHLVIEPGRSLIARAGVALYTVTGRKQVVDGPTFVHIDGGMGDNLRPALYQAQYQATLVEQPLAAATQTVQLAGRYCESGDILIHDLRLPPVEPGAILAVPMAGAYTLSMSSTYNGVGRPALLLLDQARTLLLQRRETVDDLVARDIALTME